MRKAALALAVAVACVCPVPAGAAPLPGAAACPMFPPNNVWRADVAGLPVHPKSATYIASIGASTGAHADFGSGTWDGGPIGIPYNVVGAGQPTSAVTFDYDDESDHVPYPIPANAAIEGGPSATGDRHVLVVDNASCTLYELYSAYQTGPNAWHAGSGAVWNLNSNALRPDTWTSADAAGLPILPGLVRYDEVAAGRIDHAIRITVPHTDRSYVWPARHQAGSANSSLPPMGLRLRLKPGFDASRFPNDVQVIVQAMKTYGVIVADNGSPWYISGVPDERWSNDDLAQFRGVHGSDFEAVDESALQVDPNSGEAAADVPSSPPADGSPDGSSQPATSPRGHTSVVAPPPGGTDSTLSEATVTDASNSTTTTITTASSPSGSELAAREPTTIVRGRDASTRTLWPWIAFGAIAAVGAAAYHVKRQRPLSRTTVSPGRRV